MKNNTECQDSMKYRILHDGTIIMAAADGHGSRECRYSKTGSQIAVNVFCHIISRVCSEWADHLLTFLKREGDVTLAREIEKEWKRRVLRYHRLRKRRTDAGPDGSKDYDGVYKLYGTTVLGIMIRNDLLYAFQLGDGDIFMIREGKAVNMTDPEKLLGVETYSLSKADAWRNVKTSVKSIDLERCLPVYFSLSTDGFSNSYRNEEELRKTIEAYVDMIQKNSPAVVQRNLRKWLEETSCLGSGDDITMLIACCE